MNNNLDELNSKIDKILEFLDIQEHRLTNENAVFKPDTLHKLIADTCHSVFRDAILNRSSYDSASDYMLNNIAVDGAKMFRSAYIPRKYGHMDYDSRYDLFRHSLSKISKDNSIALEFGVYRGGSIEFMLRYVDMHIYGFDSFEGLPDHWFSGDQSGRFDLGGLAPAIDSKQVTLIKGWFKDTVDNFFNSNRESDVGFIHFDCDLYCSHKDIFEALSKNKVNLDGTICLFDEYINYPGWQNDGFKALQEFVAQTGWKYRYIGYTPRYTAAAIEFFRN
ncbi:TylF/MycF/NovP-related O-methyltransferase [Aliagarivorans marinus]|uniref:TylF/MycF/NovP-related O-methyltransferase n=1 Tax=Aliagarivorans marinus TaxID=561965 RepID=UPI00041F43D1|nr:TylF/MycF/NovP-related O-methyltransferase [Aliagarivorans marinus]